MYSFNRLNYLSLLLFLPVLLSTGCAQPEPKTDAPHAEHASAGKPETHTEGGLSQDYGWHIWEAKGAIPVGKPVIITSKITTTATKLPVRDFMTVHEKLSHLIVVSRDLTVFQHVHPEMKGPGEMVSTITFPKTGEYVLYMQFATSEKGEQTVRQNLQVGVGSMAAATLTPDADKPKTIDGYTFKLSKNPQEAGKEAMPTISIEKKGKPVSTKAYLGAGGHMVVLSADANQFLHVHPMTEGKDGVFQSPISFHTEIPKAGLYKLWAQFLIDGKLQTVDFTFAVK